MKTRSIKTLLTLVLNKIESRELAPCYKPVKDSLYPFSGLCILAFNMFAQSVITDKELDRLTKFIDEHKPSRYKKDSGWYWEKYKLAPRIRWLKYWIKKV